MGPIPNPCSSQSEIKVCDVVWATQNWVWFICHGEKLSVFAILTMMTLWVGNGGLQGAFWETSCCFIPDNGALYCISDYCLGSFLNVLGHCDVVVTYRCSKADPLIGFKWMIVLRSKDHLFFWDGCSCEQLHRLCRIKKKNHEWMIKDQPQVVHLRALTTFPQNFLLVYNFLGFCFT